MEQLIRKNKYTIFLIAIILAALGGSYWSGQKSGKAAGVAAAKGQVLSIKREVWQQNMTNCRKITRKNRSITANNFDLDKLGWRLAEENRNKLARVTNGEEKKKNLEAARSYEIITDGIHRVKNPTCLESYGSKP